MLVPALEEALMNRLTLRAAAALTALAAVATTAAGDLDRTTLASRYASFQRTQTARWAPVSTLTGLQILNPLTGVVDRTVRYQVRLTTGAINPTTTPMMQDDLNGRRPFVDQHIGITASRPATGRDVLVAVLDSGFNLAHPMIAPRVLPYGYDAVGHDWDPTDRGNGVDDDHDGLVDAGVGHGTFVAGTVLHVAPDAWILPVRIADDEGYGVEEELLSGIDFAIAMGVDVVNISYEAGTITVGVGNKLREARAAGITVVVSAGNDASEQAKTLAADGTTISVGASDDLDRVAPFSNAPSDGRGITLFAPGVDLWGPHGGPSNTANCQWSGTSFSAPLATGAVALALELNPAMTPDQLHARLLAASAAPVQAWNGSTYPYAGRLNLVLVVNP
jgi:hypothetical protein